MRNISIVLTIEKGNSNALTLTFPNTEVRKSFTESLVEMFIGIDVSTYAVEGVRALKAKNLEKLTKTMNAFLNEFPYSLIGKRERSYQQAFYAFFLMIGGCRIDAEEETLSGRSDCVLSTSHDLYIIEMKVDRNVEEAIEQIKKKKYYARYINSEKTIHIIGMNFSSNDRQIKEWKEEIIDKTKEKTYLE